MTTSDNVYLWVRQYNSSVLVKYLLCCVVLCCVVCCVVIVLCYYCVVLLLLCCGLLCCYRCLCYCYVAAPVNYGVTIFLIMFYYLVVCPKLCVNNIMNAMKARTMHQVILSFWNSNQCARPNPHTNTR